MNGLIPPQNTEAEIAVLGAIFQEKKAIDRVSNFLTPEMFYKPENKAIYEAVLELYGSKSPIDILTVTKQLRANGKLAMAGGPVFISELTIRVSSSANIEIHARMIFENWMRREMITFGSEIARKAFSDSEDVFDLLDAIDKFKTSMMAGLVTTEVPHVSEAIKEMREDIVNRQESDLGISGIPSYIRDLDSILGGFSGGKIYFTAGRPGMGKTAALCSWALNQAINGYKVGIFSLEMTAKDLAFRFVSQVSKINGAILTKYKLDREQMTKTEMSAAAVEKMNIYIDDTAAITLQDLYYKAKNLVEKKGVQIIYIDYIQLMRFKFPNKSNANREQEISEISRGLKQMSKDLNIPVVILAQLSRQVEQRGGDKRPLLSDLRESGSLEQDADVVMMLYRPEYYGIMADAEGNSTAGLCELDVAKHRGGRVGDVMMKFVPELTLFEDWDGGSFGYKQPEVPNPNPNPNSRIEPNTSFEDAPF